MKLRYNVAAIAQQKGYNAHRLAVESQLTYNTVRSIWAGTTQRADLDTLARLATTLQVKVGDLFAEVEEGDANHN
jgi:DNA-binding Xre family transcriptional regulator